MAVALSVTMPNLPEFATALDELPAMMEAAEREAMQKSVFYVEAQAKARVPRVTGRLFSSIQGEVLPIGGGVQGTVGTPVMYAGFVEYGRGPVVARNAKALRFKVGGRYIFRKSVGPAAAKPYLRPALEASLDAVTGFFAAAINGVFAKVAASVNGR